MTPGLASNDGTTRTIYLSPLVLVTATPVAPWPGTMPIGTPGQTTPVLTISPPAQFNREGEIQIELVTNSDTGGICRIDNGTDDNDRRDMSWNAPDLNSDHRNNAGTSNTTAAVVTSIDPLEPFKARLRWNRAGLVDGIASAFVVVRAEQGAIAEQDEGRTAVWTASTTPVDRLALLSDLTTEAAGLVFGVRLSARERKF